MPIAGSLEFGTGVDAVRIISMCLEIIDVIITFIMVGVWWVMYIFS